MTITTTAAANLAFRHYDAMRMVSERSAFHVPAGVSPTQVLQLYLQACEDCGVQLHNEHWVKHAKAVVEDLEANRRRAFDLMMRRKPTKGI